MTPRHASASRLREARITGQARKAARRAYIALLTALAFATGLWTAYALTTGGPS